MMTENQHNDSTVTEATVLEKVLDVAEEAEEFRVLEYEVDRMNHRHGRVEVTVDMAVRERDGVGLEELTDEDDDIEVQVCSKGGGCPFASITLQGEWNSHDF